METDIMAHQVLFRNSIISILITVLIGCGNKTFDEAVESSPFLLNKNEQRIIINNGLLQVENSPFTGVLYTLFPNTTDTATVEKYLNGKEHGEWKKYFLSHKLKEKRFFTNGKKTGEYIAWWNNGNKQLQYFFSEDEYEGTCKEWSESGLLNKILNYKKGYEEGHQQWWYDNGKIKANYIIKEGRRYGLLGTKNCINVSDSIFKN